MLVMGEGSHGMLQFDNVSDLETHKSLVKMIVDDLDLKLQFRTELYRIADEEMKIWENGRELEYGACEFLFG